MTYAELCTTVKREFEGDYDRPMDGCAAFDMAGGLMSDPEFMPMFRAEHPEHEESTTQIIKEIIADDLCSA